MSPFISQMMQDVAIVTIEDEYEQPVKWCQFQ